MPPAVAERPRTAEAPPSPSRIETIKPENKSAMPIYEKEDEIKQALHEYDTIIVMAQPGSGKTTQIPLFVLDELHKLDPTKKMLVTQPRRIAASDISTEMDTYQGGKGLIGHQLKGDSNVNQSTKVIFTVDQSLFNMIKRDDTLNEYAVIMLDEVHLRGKKTDSILSSINDVQAARKAKGLPPLKVLITSGTLNKELFTGKFPQAKLIESKGTIQTITPEYATQPIPYDRLADEAAKKIQDIIVNRKREGNVLVFLPGKGEIAEQRKALEKLGISGVNIVEVHGEMDLAAQKKAIKDDGTQKIILSTDVTEAAVTPEKVFTVVDWGFVRQNVLDKEETGWERLELVKQTKDGLRQRAGRGGRLGPGLYVAMFTEQDYNERPEFLTPEILRTQVADVILDIAYMGKDPRNYPYFEAPEKGNLERGIETLKQLGALDQQEKLTTDIGEKMAQLQMDPHFARMLVEAHKRGCLPEVATIVAMLNAKGLYDWKKAGSMETPQDRTATRNKANAMYAQFKDSQSDFLTLLNIWSQNNKEPDGAARKAWQESHYLSPKAIKSAVEQRRDIIKSLGNVFDGVKLDELVPVDLSKGDEVQKCILPGLADRILNRDGSRSYKSDKGEMSGIEIGDFSIYNERPPAQIAAADIFIGSRNTKANSVQPVDSKLLKEVAPYLYKDLNLPDTGSPSTPASTAESAPASPTQSEPALATAQAKMQEAIKKADEAVPIPKPVETTPPPKKETKTLGGELKTIYQGVKAELKKIWAEFKAAFKRK